MGDPITQVWCRPCKRFYQSWQMPHPHGKTRAGDKEAEVTKDENK